MIESGVLLGGRKVGDGDVARFKYWPRLGA
jgi:hypothetical protein